MLKYLRYILLVIPRVIGAYFAWMIKYARHPERYPFEVRYQRVRELVLFIFRHFRVDIHIEGREFYLQGPRPFVIYANHISYVDPLLLIAMSEKPISFVAKKESLSYPFIGKVMRILEGVAIDRSNLRSQIVAMDRAVKIIESGRSIAIFPEGTRNRHPELGLNEFKPGAFKLSYRTGAPIIACAFYGTDRPLSMKSKLKSYPLWVRFFEPIAKNEFLQFSTVDMASQVRLKIQTEINNVMKPNDCSLLKKADK